MNTRRFISFSTMLLTTVSSVFSQCIVAGTEFNTEPELCNPTMVSDDNEENGWFSSNVAEIIAKQCSNSNFFEHPSNVIQKGLPSNKLSVVGNASITWKELLKAKNPSGKDTGLVVVTSNPKLISPYLSEGNGSAMLVAMGNGFEFPFFTYTVEGLVPNSTVTMTLDVYDLLDINELETALKVMNSGVTSAKDYITEIPLPYGGSYIVRSNAGKLDYSQSIITGSINNQFSIVADTKIGSMGSAPTMATSVTPTNEGKQMKISAKTDDAGMVSFYLWRNPGGSARPIGLDNIAIEGELMPVIKAGESPCPMNPYTMRLRSTYPAGTTYSWKVAEDGSQTSDMATFSFIPEIAGNYNVTCDVTLPGCKSAKSKTFTFETSKNCCESADGIPLSMITIYKNDFGQFIGSNYVYSDAAGNDYSVPVTESSYCGILQDVIKNQLDNSVNVRYDKDFCSSGDAYVITTEDPYSGSGGDHTGNGNGGMLIMDLKSDGWKNKAIFKKEIEDLCKGIYVHFSAAVQAFNDISQHIGYSSVGTVELHLKSSSGEILATSGEVTLTKPGWFELSSEVMLSKDEPSVTLELISLEDDYTGDGRGDFAVDDIKIQVCAPPDVDIKSNLSGEESLNLCSDKEFVLKAVTTTAVKKYYRDIHYLFQWTKDDPSVVEEPVWYDLGAPSTEDTYVFTDPVNEEPFLSGANKPGNKFFFRLVVGNKDTLISERNVWEDMNAQTPCRNVSISNIPIIAGLNCPTCVMPNKVNVVLSTGRIKENAIYLCPGESEKLEVGEIIGTDADNNPYYNYVVSWYKNDINSTPLMKKACSDADHGAHTFIISYDDVIADGKDEAKYILLIHDNSDPSLSSTPCDHADTIRVVANSRPDQTLWYNNPSICQGTDYKIEHIPGFKINWYKDKDALERIEEPVIGDLKIDDPMGTGLLSYYYTLTDNNTGCQGDVHEFTVEISNVTNTVDNTNKIEYYKKDVKDGQLKSLEEQNKTVFKSALSMPDYTLMIGLVENATEATAPDLKSAKLGTASYIIPTPTVKDVDSKDDEYLWYYTYLVSANGCVSDTVLVGVIINGEETSLTNAPAKAVSITPNPASTKVSVIAEEAVEKVEILNMVGEVVKVSNRKDIDTSNLSNGVYFVRTTINDETTVHKLVINK